MKISEIKSRALNLIEQCDELENNDLSIRVLNAHYYKLDEIFHELFSEFRKKSDLIAEFKRILNDNWEFIKGTGLSYTAIPNYEATLLMIDIAIFISEEDSLHPHPLLLLMPSINLESAHEQFPDLNTIECSTEALLYLFQTHILGQNSLYLLPVQLLALQEIPPDSNKLPNPYFNYAHHPDQHAYLNADELDRLYKHSPLTSEVLCKKTIYENVVNSQLHLLGQIRKLCRELKISNRYHQGNEMEAGNSAYQGILDFTKFYNTLFGKKLYLMSTPPHDLALYNHSYLWNGRELFFVKNQALISIEILKPVEFLAILRQIQEIHQTEGDILQLQPLEMHQLIDENTSHHSIDSRISSHLKHEIILLLNFSSNPEMNVSGTISTETCVVTRRESLVLHASQQEELLSQFHIEDSDASQIAQMGREYFEAKQALSTAISDKDYTDGFDELEGYGQLIESLEIDLELHTIDDLKFIEMLHPETVTDILRNRSLRYQAVFLLPSVDELLFYLLSLPTEKTKLFLDITKHELCEELIYSTRELGELLRVLDGERCGVVLETFASLHIKSIPDFIGLQDELDVQPFKIGCNQLITHLLPLMTIESFHHAYGELAHPDKKTFWKECFLPKIQELVISLDDFALVKSFFDENQIENIFERCKMNWLRQVTSAQDFKKIMEVLDAPQKTVIFALIQDSLYQLMVDIDSVSTILSYIELEHFKEFCADWTVIIAPLIENNTQLIQLTEHLPIEKLNTLVGLMGKHVLCLTLKQEDSVRWQNPPLLIALFLDIKPIFLKLAHICDETNAYKLIESLVFDKPEKIQKRFQKLMSNQLGFTIFSPIMPIDKIVDELVQLPEHLTGKLFNALSIPQQKLSIGKQKNALKEYISESGDQQTVAKKRRLHAPP